MQKGLSMNQSFIPGIPKNLYNKNQFTLSLIDQKLYTNQVKNNVIYGLGQLGYRSDGKTFAQRYREREKFGFQMPIRASQNQSKLDAMEEKLFKSAK